MPLVTFSSDNYSSNVWELLTTISPSNVNMKYPSWYIVDILFNLYLLYIYEWTLWECNVLANTKNMFMFF